jgi:hypothetical protein
MLAPSPERFAAVHGSTDTEVVFQLALTPGLEDDPLGAMERSVGLIEETARSLFASADVDAVRRLHPDNPGSRVSVPTIG